MTAEAINAATLVFRKALIERALGGEMSHHLGYPLTLPSRTPWPTSAMAPVPRLF
ncbi:ISPsy18, transposase [Burkholderia pseudomallei 668]|nr:ISPsy18, transposase [Burkholderia pseudomallei 668]